MYKVLIVEDEKIICSGLRTQINWNSMGFTICGEASNGCEAMEFLKIHGDIDVILTDIKMPNMDGIEMIQKIRESGSEITIIVLSGHNDFEYTKKSIKYNVFDYILKPSVDEEVYEVFARLRRKLDSKAQEIQAKSVLQNEEPLKGKTHINNIYSTLFRDNNTKNLDSIYKELAHSGVQVNGNFCVITFSIHDTCEVEYTIMPEESEFSEIIGIQWNGLVVSGFVIEKEHNRIIFIVEANECPDVSNVNALVNILKAKMISLFNTIYKYDVHLSCGISQVKNSITSLKALFNDALDANKLKFFYGYGCFNSENIKQHIERYKNKNMASLNNMLFVNDLLFAYNNKNKNEIEKVISIYFERIGSVCSNTDHIYTNIVEIWLILISKLNADEINEIVKLKIDIYKQMARIIDDGNINDVKNLFIELLIYLKNFNNESAIDDKEKMMKNIKQYTNDHLSDKINLNDIAKATYYSTATFSIIFKRYTGMSFTKYLTELRINKAKELLLSRDIKIYEVAEMVGFYDYRHFSRVFNKMEGINPKSFQKRGY